MLFVKKDIIEINDNKLFGYKVVREESIGSGKKRVEYVIMERDKNLRNYITLKNLEDDYYKAMDEDNEFEIIPRAKKMSYPNCNLHNHS